MMSTLNVIGKSLTETIEIANKHELITIILPSNSTFKLKNELTILTNIIIEGNNSTLIASKTRHFNVLAGQNLTLKNLTLKNGIANTGGSILVKTTNNHNLLLENVIIKNNEAIYGGAIYSYGDIIIKNSKILLNKAIKQGGGIWCYKNVTMNDSLVNLNHITEISNDNHGAGIVINDGILLLSNSSISYNKINYSRINQIGGYAGGVNIISGSLIIEKNSRINNNIAFNSAAIQMGLGDINVFNSTISKNRSFSTANASGGGGIVILAGNVIIQNSKISHNITQGMYSGGIVSIFGNITIINSIISHNKNKGPGGAIASNFNSTITIENSKIIKNTGASLGGAIVNFSFSQGQIYIINSILSNNILTNEQLIKQTIEEFLKIIINFLSSYTSYSKTFSKVLSKIKEIIALAEERHALFSQIIPLINATGGGAIATLLTCPITITNSEISNNYATLKTTSNNPIFSGFGGGIFSIHSQITINNTKFKNNKAINTGSAIYTNNLLTINDSIINKNNNIALLNTKNGTTILLNTIFIDNNIDIENNGQLTLINTKINNH